MPPAEKKEPGEATINNSSQETVIIFDWDDTLLASSFLSSKGYRLDNEVERTNEVDTQLKELEQSVCTVLNLSLSYGRVHIITNAETGWVQLSAQKFIPGVVPLLNKVKVLSARSTYETMFPESPLKWKYYAFQEKLSTSNCNPNTKLDRNVISFGDSHVEREAVRAVTRGLPNTRTKSVKFAERPSLEQLRRELELVVNCLNYIIGHDGDLDLQLTVTVNTDNSNNNQNNSSSSVPSSSNPTNSDFVPCGSSQSDSLSTTSSTNSDAPDSIVETSTSVSSLSCHSSACSSSPILEKECNKEEFVRS